MAAARDVEGRRRGVHLRGALRGRAARRRGGGALQCGARGGLSRADRGGAGAGPGRGPRAGSSRPDPGALAADVARLRRRLGEVVARDFFGAPGREALEGFLTRLAPDGVAGPPRQRRSTRPSCAVGPGSPARASTSTASPAPGSCGGSSIRTPRSSSSRRRATARRPARSASTCSTPSSPTTATAAPSRSSSRGSGSTIRRCGPSREIVHDIDLKERQVRATGDRGRRPSGGRPLHGPSRRRGPPRARRRALRRPLRVLPKEARMTTTSARPAAEATDGPLHAPRRWCCTSSASAPSASAARSRWSATCSATSSSTGAGSRSRTTARAWRSRSSRPGRSPRSSRSTSAGSAAGRSARRSSPSPSSCRRS